MLRTWRLRDGESGRAAGAFQFERLAVKVTPWRVVLAGVGVGTYLLGLLILLPAEVAVPNDRDAVGTVWNGEAALNGGFAAGWRTQPFASVAHAGLAEGLIVRGPATALTGQAIVRPGGLVLRDLDGLASARLLNAVAPALPFTCEADLRVAVSRLAIKGRPRGAGSVRSSTGECAGADGASAMPLAAMTGTLGADAAATSFVLTRTGSTETLARARIAPDGKMTLTVELAGVGALPGFTAPVSIETTL